jgi:hypothetical protein
MSIALYRISIRSTWPWGGIDSRVTFPSLRGYYTSAAATILVIIAAISSLEMDSPIVYNEP